MSNQQTKSDASNGFSESVIGNNGIRSNHLPLQDRVNITAHHNGTGSSHSSSRKISASTSELISNGTNNLGDTSNTNTENTEENSSMNPAVENMYMVKCNSIPSMALNNGLTTRSPLTTRRMGTVQPPNLALHNQSNVVDDKKDDRNNSCKNVSLSNSTCKKTSIESISNTGRKFVTTPVEEITVSPFTYPKHPLERNKSEDVPYVNQIKVFHNFKRPLEKSPSLPISPSMTDNYSQNNYRQPRQGSKERLPGPVMRKNFSTNSNPFRKSFRSSTSSNDSDNMGSRRFSDMDSPRGK